MAGMRTSEGELVFVIGGGQYVNIMGEDRSGEETINVVFKNEDALKLGQLLIEQSGLANGTTEEFLPDNPGDSAPYFYYVTESESEARDGLHDSGKLMRRLVTNWEEVK